MSSTVRMVFGRIGYVRSVGFGFLAAEAALLPPPRRASWSCWEPGPSTSTNTESGRVELLYYLLFKSGPQNP